MSSAKSVAHEAEHASEHVVGIGMYLAIFVSLMVLTAITTAVAYVDLGALNNVVMLGIAVLKATLVVLFFMHVRFNSRLTQMFALCGFVWILLLFAFTVGDVATRGILR
ncbi:MAG: cytochrome C oxidase subunit IV family protein [bacterium]|nr:cytochrome C oxidase subunit IV family protein [bacterium]